MIKKLHFYIDICRQTVSKWENGLSVPDSELLIAISEELETPVSVLLGETVKEQKSNDLKIISEKLEVINLQLAKRKEIRRKTLFWGFISICVVIILIFAALIIMNSPYLEWNYNDTETAVLGTIFHSFEFLFVRIAPIVFLGAVVGALLTRKNK